MERVVGVTNGYRGPDDGPGSADRSRITQAAEL